MFSPLESMLILLVFMGVQVRKKLKHNCAAVQFPIGLEDQIKGLVDLVHNQAYYSQGAHG